MNVLFIVPTPGYGLILDNKISNKRTAGFFPPLGVAFLATVLEQSHHKCKVLDLQVRQFTKKELLFEIKSFNTDVVCISVLTALAPEAFLIAKLIKEEINIPIICGGQHVSLFPKQILIENSAIDFIVYGEGEYKLLNLINQLEKKGKVDTVKGLFLRKEKKIIYTGDAPTIDNLDVLPIPSRHFFDLSKYLPVANQYKRFPIANMITSRGCTYRLCKFCSESGELHSKYRRMSVDHAIEEIKYLISKYGIKEIYFWDDEFIMDHKWIEEFCSKLKIEKFDLIWSCYAKVNYVNAEILKKMSSVGCWNIFYGLESGDQSLLNNISKGQTIKQIKDAIRWTQEAGIEAKGSFMLGLPGETPELARKTIDFAIELDLDYAMFCLTTPYPGTKLYEEFIKGSKDQEMNFEKYTCFAPVYLPDGYSNREQLIQLQKEAYRRFYIRFGYFKRKLKAINSKDDIFRYLGGIKYLVKSKLNKNLGL